MNSITPSLINSAKYNLVLQLVRILLIEGYNLNETTVDGRTALHYAIQRGNLECAKLLINSGEININAQENMGMTPLHSAIFAPHTKRCDAIKLLIENGAVINIIDANKFTPLHLAAKHGALDCVKLLIANGSDIDYTISNHHVYDYDDDDYDDDYIMYPPLYYAAVNGHADVVQYLLSKGASVNHGLYKNIRLLRRISSKMYKRVSISLTRFRYAPRNTAKYIPIIKMLLFAGMPFKPVNSGERSLLEFAVTFNIVELAKVLLEAGAKSDEVVLVDPFIHNAIINNNTEMVKLLISYNATINQKELYGKHTSVVVAQFGNVNILKLLLDAELDIEYTYYSRMKYPFVETLCEFKKYGLIKTIITHEYTKHNSELMHELLRCLSYIVNKYSVKLIRLLLESGANPNCMSHGGSILMTVFYYNRHIPSYNPHVFNVVKMLIDFGADVNSGAIVLPNSIDFNTCIPLHESALHGDYETTQLLIEKGSDVNRICIVTGQTPLHKAVLSNNSRIIKCLLDAGANINSASKSGLTPICLAQKTNKIEALKVLLNYKEVHPWM